MAADQAGGAAGPYVYASLVLVGSRGDAGAQGCAVKDCCRGRNAAAGVLASAPSRRGAAGGAMERAL
jgi:hypothetical protein